MPRVLLVDDDAAFAQPLVQLLDQSGHEVELVPSAPAAIERVRACRFDVLVTEAAPPGMSGVQLLSELRVVDPGLPVIVTGAVDAHLELRALAPLALMRDPLPLASLCELVASARRDALLVLVEDDVLLADNLQEILAQAGFSTLHLANVRAIDALPALPYLAAVVDLRLPDGRDGEGLMRLAARFPGMPLIAVSGLDLAPPVRPLEYLYKPLDAGRLLALVEGLHRPT